MSITTPAVLIRTVLDAVSRDDWRNDESALEDLRHCVLGDPLDIQFEFFGVPRDAWVTNEKIEGDKGEMIIGTQSLPYKAELALDAVGRWRLKEFLAQCTGCLGSGLIVDQACSSCSGTGWGLRPLLK